MRKHFFHSEGDQTMAQVAQRGCGVLEDVQKPTGTRQVGLDSLQRCLPASAVPLFCN